MPSITLKGVQHQRHEQGGLRNSGDPAAQSDAQSALSQAKFHARIRVPCGIFDDLKSERNAVAG